MTGCGVPDMVSGHMRGSHKQSASIFFRAAATASEMTHIMALNHAHSLTYSLSPSFSFCSLQDTTVPADLRCLQT